MKAPTKPAPKAKIAPPKQAPWKIEQSPADAKGDKAMMKGKKGC